MANKAMVAAPIKAIIDLELTLPAPLVPGFAAAGPVAAPLLAVVEPVDVPVVEPAVAPLVDSAVADVVRDATLALGVDEAAPVD